ncbi:hypothetical protein Hdeb2414_s0011g00365531 [Helianthus debilis subsp. tardiflorus]
MRNCIFFRQQSLMAKAYLQNFLPLSQISSLSPCASQVWRFLLAFV